MRTREARSTVDAAAADAERAIGVVLDMAFSVDEFESEGTAEVEKKALRGHIMEKLRHIERRAKDAAGVLD
ncbi:MAG: hypothetical protein F4X25_10150 [Chloroflexi bacterium]|nr:hypothetical protein [Chloroflexota bacterium]